MSDNTFTTHEQSNEVTALRSAPLSGSTIPDRVLVAPWGQVESSNGSFVVDEEAASLAVAAFDEQGTDLPLDYEHQTLGGRFSSPTGQAPAAGWIKRLSPEGGVGLIAEIEWTEQAKRMLAAKEYRYVSPVAIIRKSDRKLVAIHSVALTNKPAIVGMQPIVNCAAMASEELCADSLDQLRSELKLEPESDAAVVLLAASRRLVDLEDAAKRRHIDERITKAMRAGKLVEAQRAWAEALVAREEALFDEWFQTAPVVLTRGAIASPDAADTGAGYKRTIAAKARAEFHSNRLLSALTSEEAFISDALRHQRN